MKEGGVEGKRGGGEGQASDAKQSLTTSHQQTDAQPFFEQWLPWKDSPTSFIAGHDVIKGGI